VIASICYALGVTYTELEKQPADWVQEMAEYLEQKNNVEEFKAKQKP